MASLIQKAAQLVSKASRGTLSSYVLNAPHQYGQPLPQQADAGSLITPERMREIALKTPTASAAVNAILDYAVQVPIRVRNVDPSKPADAEQVRFVQNFLRKPNAQDTERRFREKVLRDMTTLGFGGIEKERNQAGGVANLYPLDAARLKVDYDEHGTILGWNTINARGVPVSYGQDKPWAWKPEDVIWMERDAVSNSVYPVSRIAMLFSSAVVEDLMLAFIGGRFTDSNVPYGVFDIGDVSNDELKRAVSIWNAQAQAQHRIMITGSKGSKWYPFGYHLKDLEAPELLHQVRSAIMGVLGVTENELGQSENVNLSNGYNLSYTFKKRCIEPLLAEYCETMTVRLLWEELGFTDLELYFEEIDSRDELIKGQIQDIYQKGGVWSVNHIRNLNGLESLPGGEEPMVFSGSAWIPISMMHDFAQAQLDAVSLEAALLKEQVKQAKQMTAMGGAAPQAGISAPMIRGAQPPDKFTTPDGAGSSSVKIKLPKPSAPQTPRGPVQTLRNAGHRKEEQQ